MYLERLFWMMRMRDNTVLFIRYSYRYTSTVRVPVYLSILSSLPSLKTMERWGVPKYTHAAAMSDEIIDAVVVCTLNKPETTRTWTNYYCVWHNDQRIRCVSNCTSISHQPDEGEENRSATKPSSKRISYLIPIDTLTHWNLFLSREFKPYC